MRFSRWRPFVRAAFWAGIVEDLRFRLIGLSFIVYLLGYVCLKTEGGPAAVSFWLANVLVSLAMAASHAAMVGSEIPYTLWNVAK